MAAKQSKTPLPVDPAIFEPRIRQAEQTIAARRAEHADLLYRREQEPANAAELSDMLGQVKAELAAAEQERDDLIATREDAARRWTVSERAAMVDRLKADKGQVEQLGRELFEVAQSIAAYIEALRPMLETFVTLDQQRADLAWGVVNAGTERNRRPEGLRAFSMMSRGSCAALVTAAFQRAGVGSLGPTTGITLPQLPEYPLRDGWFGPVGSRVRISEDRSRPWHAPNADLVSLTAAELQRENAPLAATMWESIARVQEGGAA